MKPETHEYICGYNEGMKLYLHHIPVCMSGCERLAKELIEKKDDRGHWYKGITDGFRSCYLDKGAPPMVGACVQVDSLAHSKN